MKLCNVLTILATMVSLAHGWQSAKKPSHNRNHIMDRRAVVAGSLAFLMIPTVANAGIDPSSLRTLPVQGDESGAAQRLRQVEAAQRPSTDLVDIPFEELPSGVSYREYRQGKGEAGAYDISVCKGWL
jgi:hypothetical protein